MSQNFPKIQPTWSDVNRLHDEMQTSKDVLEKNLDRVRRARYKDELDQILKSHRDEKEEQKKEDARFRELYRRELQEQIEKDKDMKYAMREIAADMAEISRRESQIRIEQERKQRELEMREQQQRFMELNEQEQKAKMDTKIKRLAISHDLMRTYDNEQQNKLHDNMKTKELDKYYVKAQAEYLEAQEKIRNDYLDSIKRRGQREDVLRKYSNIYQEQARKREEFEKNLVERGYTEKVMREAATQRQRNIQRELLKHETIDTLKFQIQQKQESQRRKKELEDQEYNLQLERSLIGIHPNDQKELYQQEQRRTIHQQEKLKKQTRDGLKKQIEENRVARHKEIVLTPMEEQYNRNYVDVIKNGPVQTNESDSFMPARDLHIEKKIQNFYINRALHLKDPQLEANPKKEFSNPILSDLELLQNNQRIEEELKSLENRERLRQQQQPNSQRKHVAFENLRRSMDLGSTNTLDRDQNVKMSRDNRHLSHSPEPINSRANILLSNPANFAWKNEYMFVRNKNGIYSNPINIVTNQYKPYTNDLFGQ